MSRPRDRLASHNAKPANTDCVASMASDTIRHYGVGTPTTWHAFAAADDVPAVHRA